VEVATGDFRDPESLRWAAEAAGVGRFVFVSASGVREVPIAGTPLGRGKIATEDRLAASTLREVILRPDQFQEVWLSPVAQFDWPKRKVVIFGKGETPVRYVAIDDVARMIRRAWWSSGVRINRSGTSASSRGPSRRMRRT
jgi:uncharacterized protein YbjT (DUF2867 family)